MFDVKTTKSSEISPRFLGRAKSGTHGSSFVVGCRGTDWALSRPVRLYFCMAEIRYLGRRAGV